MTQCFSDRRDRLVFQRATSQCSVYETCGNKGGLSTAGLECIHRNRYCTSVTSCLHQLHSTVCESIYDNNTCK